MNVKVLKRIEALEKRTAAAKSPNFVMIFYDEAAGGYKVRESYGDSPKTFKSKEFVLEHYSGYIFREDMECNVLLETMAAPEPPQDLFAFSVSDVRKIAGLAKNTAFAITAIKDKPDSIPPEAEFEIIAHERK